MFSRRLLVPLGAAAFIAVTPALASAAVWSVNGSGSAKATAGSLSTPSGSAGTATQTTVPITWTAATAGTVQAQATYTVTSSPGAKTCSAASTTTGCTVTGLTAGTAYTFSIVAAIANNWTSGSGSAGSATTSAASDTTGPVITPTCPTSGGAYTLKSGPTNGTWITTCGEKVSLTATDATGIASIKISVRAGTTSGNYLSGSGGNFNQSSEVQITASVNAGTYSIVINDNKLVAGGTYTVKVYGTDTVTPTANQSTTTYTFSVS